MTPRQLHALRKRQIENLQYNEMLFGIVASTTANYSFCRPEQPLSPNHFMIHRLPESKPQAFGGEGLMSIVRALPSQFIRRAES